MRRCLALSAIMFLCIGGGCVNPPANLDPAVVAASIQLGAETTINLGLRATARDQATYVRIKTDTAQVSQFITASVLPLFQGSDLKPITVATAQQALSLLNGKVSATVSLVIQEAINGVLLVLKLPDNPTTTGLSDFQKTVIVALLNGINAGISDFQSWPGPADGTRDLAPNKGVTLAWKKGGIPK